MKKNIVPLTFVSDKPFQIAAGYRIRGTRPVVPSHEHQPHDLKTLCFLCQMLNTTTDTRTLGAPGDR